MFHVARQRGRSTSTHLVPGMSARERVRTPQNGAAHVTGISTAGHGKRQAAAQLVGDVAGQGARTDGRSLRRSSIRGGCGVSFFQVVKRSRGDTPTEAGLLREAP